MKRAIAAMLVAIVAVGGFMLFRDDDKGYKINMEMANASGLRSGSPVVVGGVRVGAVDLEADQDKVTVELNIEPQYKPIGKDAKASVIAQNVLGQKQVQLDVGDMRKPAPAGYTLPAPQVRTSTDLDQLLATLDADTRTRLAILINEAGMGFDGRKLDFRTFVSDLRPALDAGGQLLTQLTEDNQALGNLVELSDSYVGELAGARKELGRAIDVFGQTTETVAARRAELRETLRRAPSTLVAARGFLSELRQTTQPLASTARLLERTAPSLSTVLDQLGPLRDAATPTLDNLTDKSVPSLLRLGEVSTARAANLIPTVKNVRRLTEDEIPRVGGVLDKSADNIIATLENWSRAIQFRDGLGHVFRGEAAFSPQAYNRIVRNLGGTALTAPRGADKQAAQRKAPQQSGAAPAAPAPTQQAPAAPAAPAKTPAQALQDLLGGVDKAGKQSQQELQQLLDNVAGKPLLPGTDPLLKQGADGQATAPLLDYLLGQ